MAPIFKLYHTHTLLMKRVKLGGKEYLEIPDDIRGKRYLIIRLEDGLYLVGLEEKVSNLLKRQISYLSSKRRKGEYKPIKSYWILESEQEAVEFSRRHGDEIQRGEIVGVRAFDGKFYAVKRETYTYILRKIIDSLKRSPKTLEELSGAINEPRDLVKAVLEIAREEGVILERGDGTYAYAG